MTTNATPPVATTSPPQYLGTLAKQIAAGQTPSLTEPTEAITYIYRDCTGFNVLFDTWKDYETETIDTDVIIEGLIRSQANSPAYCFEFVIDSHRHVLRSRSGLIRHIENSRVDVKQHYVEKIHTLRQLDV